MILTLSDSRMLSLWRSGARLEPALSDASIERFDAIDINGTLRSAMRGWYLELLRNGPLDLVPVTDIANRVEVKAAHADGAWTLTLPPDISRAVSLTVKDYGTVAVIDPDAEHNRPALAAMCNRFVRVGSVPKAVYRPGSREMTVYSPVKPTVTSLRAVVVCEDDTYVLDERALALIPQAACQAIENV